MLILIQVLGHGPGGPFCDKHWARYFERLISIPSPGSCTWIDSGVGPGPYTRKRFPFLFFFFFYFFFIFFILFKCWPKYSTKILAKFWPCYVILFKYNVWLTQNFFGRRFH